MPRITDQPKFTLENNEEKAEIEPILTHTHRHTHRCFLNLDVLQTQNIAFFDKANNNNELYRIVILKWCYA